MGGNIVVPELRVMLRPEIRGVPVAVDGFNFRLMGALQESLDTKLRAKDVGKTQNGHNMVVSTDPGNQFVLDIRHYEPAGFARTIQADIKEPCPCLLETSFLADLNALRPVSRDGLLTNLITLVSKQTIATLTVVDTPDELVTQVFANVFRDHCPFMLVNESMALGKAFPALVAQLLVNNQALGLP